ncbi:MAG: hypothetical protein GC168_05815 [Candidatus Hydrogenedens sp.]|nr:hypothetical protein [Candidatus Hydrogenedens sp.]
MHAMQRLMLFLALTGTAVASAQSPVSSWISSEDGTHLLAEQPALAWSEGPCEAEGQLFIDPGQTAQSILGLGASLEHATCYNLSLLGDADRDAVLRKLVHPADGIGMNLMRICIGTSDFVGEDWYSYCDTPDNAPDPELTHFSIEKDRAYVLPALRAALRINPDLKFIAAPWSPPAWMKTNGSMLAGKLKPEYYDAFARYLVKFIEAYAAEGIPIHSITPQNEPDFPNPKYPTCFYKPEDEMIFIRDHLGPLMKAKGSTTEIWCLDHNWNLLDFPETIYGDPVAREYVSGTAFHLYEGQPEAQSQVHEAFPDKAVYFTEGSTFWTRGAVQIIEILQHWSRSYNAWVVMLDEDRKPNNGPHMASQTSVELKKDGTVAYNFDYYMYGHFTKFIARGAERLVSEPGDRRFNRIGFKNPDGSIVVVAANPMRTDRTFSVHLGDKHFRATIPGRSLVTFRWGMDS